MPATCYIYTLHASNDPTCRPRYVGFTINPKSRQASHNRIEKHGRKAAWVRSLREVGARVVLTVIHTFRSDDFTERGMVEETWIRSYRSKYVDLLNDMEGGEGLSHCSSSARLKMSAAAKRRCADSKYRAKISASVKQVWKSPARASLLAAIKRKWENPTTRQKMSESSKRRWADPLARAEKSARLKERCAKPEVRAVMSQNFKKGWNNPVSRQRMSAENKRRWADPIYRKKLCAARAKAAQERKLQKSLDEY